MIESNSGTVPAPSWVPFAKWMDRVDWSPSIWDLNRRYGELMEVAAWCHYQGREVPPAVYAELFGEI